MTIQFLTSFARDLRKVRDTAVLEQVRTMILAVEEAPDLRSVSNLKKLAGRGPNFRIRVGEYRVGIRVEDSAVTFVRVLLRRDVYRYFP